jgi:hypothetical protein
MKAGQCLDLMDYGMNAEIPAGFGLVDHSMMVETIQNWCFDLADRNKLDWSLSLNSRSLGPKTKGS